MHETRNLIVIISLVVCGIWAFLAWLVFADPFGEASASVWWQRGIATAGVVGFGVWTWYALVIEDKLPDKLAETVGSMYYDVDGLSFMPTVRINPQGQAELSVYYQNRFENYAQAIVHMRLPEDGQIAGPGVRDLHFAFKANGGDFGVLHQPIAVPRHLQGQVIDVQLATAVRYPRSHGARLRSNEGLPCGSLVVDWGQAFKVGVHEVSGEIDLDNPCTVHLSLPMEAKDRIEGTSMWKQELLEPGPSDLAVMA